MKWFITGGCGFIGGNLISSLVRSGVDSNSLCVYDNLSASTLDDLSEHLQMRVTTSEPSSNENLDGSVRLIVGDILDYERLNQSVNGFDIVVHLAANTGVGPSIEDPKKDCETNVLGTLNCLQAAHANSVRKFIFASSGAPCGGASPPIHEAVAPKPVNPYGASKLAGEGYCSAFYGCFQLDTTVLRFSNVYGPGSSKKQSVVAKFIKRLLDEEHIEIYGDGNQTRDYIYIDDLIDAINICATNEAAAGEIFQIATGIETTINDLLGELTVVFRNNGLSPPKSRNVDEMLGDVRRNYSDTTKARSVLKWEPKYQLRAGLQTTLEYFLEEQKRLSS